MTLSLRCVLSTDRKEKVPWAWKVIALCIASPVAWYLMSKWLQGFAYRITINWWMFLLAGAAAIG